jgi:hypothetical protein
VQPLQRAARELDAAEADLALARGHLLHTRFLLERDADPDALALAAVGSALARAAGAGRTLRELDEARAAAAG